MMEYKTLREIANITMGQSPDSSSYNEIAEGIPFFQGNADFGEIHPTERVWCSAPKKIAKANDILISVRAPIGALNYAETECCIGRGLAAITVDDPIERNYIYHLLKAKNGELNRRGTGSTFKAIGKSVLEELQVPMISSEEKMHAMQIMDSAERIIKQRRAEIIHLNELIKARFIEMFGDPEENPLKWEKKPLSELIINANNGMARRGNDELGNIVLRLVELQDGFIDYSNPNRILLNDKEQKRYLLKNKDFLFARVNGNPENVGRCAVFYDIGEPVYHNDHIIRVHFNEDILDGPFASALLNSDYGKRQLKNQIKTSAGQYTVSQDGIGAIVSPVPPINIQKQFASFVDQVDRSKAAVQKALDETQLLFDSLMQEYFG